VLSAAAGFARGQSTAHHTGWLVIGERYVITTLFGEVFMKLKLTGKVSNNSA
jgi:hypothetical protein